MSDTSNEQTIQDIITVHVVPDTEPRKRKFRRGGISSKVQAANLQRFVYDAAMSLRESITDKESGKLVMNEKIATAVHRLLGAWDTAADRYRIARGKGLPASVKPASPKRTQEMKPLSDA